MARPDQPFAQLSPAAQAILALAKKLRVQVTRRGRSWHFLSPTVDIRVADPVVLRPSDFIPQAEREISR